MDSSGLSLIKLAAILGVSQPFLSQIRAGKRLLPEALKRKSRLSVLITCLSVISRRTAQPAMKELEIA